MAEPVGAVAQRYVRIHVDSVSPAAPLEMVFGAVVENVRQLWWPAAALPHSPCRHAVKDATLTTEDTRQVVPLIAVSTDIVVNTVCLIRVRKIFICFFGDVKFVKEAWGDDMIALSYGRYFILIVHQYLTHNFVVEGRVFTNTKVDHHAEDFIWVKGLLGDVQVERVANSVDYR